MYLSTQTFMALAAALAVGINASPLNARATGCTEFDNAPPGSVAQKNAIAACKLRWLGLSLIHRLILGPQVPQEV